MTSVRFHEDARRDAAVEMLKRHARAVRPEVNYDADIEYLEHAVIAFADEWARTVRPAFEQIGRPEEDR